MNITIHHLCCTQEIWSNIQLQTGSRCECVWFHASVAHDGGFIYSERSNMQYFSTSSISLSHNPWPAMPTNLLCITLKYLLITYTSPNIIDCEQKDPLVVAAIDRCFGVTPPTLNKQLIRLLPPLFWWKKPCCKVILMTFVLALHEHSQLSVKILTSTEDGSVNNVHEHLCNVESSTTVASYRKDTFDNKISLISQLF